MHSKDIEKYFFLGFLALVTIFVLILFRPFFPIIILGASFAVVLHPLYVWFSEKITKGRSWASALLAVIVFVVAVCGPLFGIGVVVFRQSQDLYQSLSGGGAGPMIQKLGESVNSVLPPEFAFNINDKITEFVSFISANIAVVFTTTLSTILSFIILILIIFYFLKDGDHWRQSVILMSPLSDKDDQKILSKLNLAINGVIKGYVIIGIAQGILMGIGLAIFGVPTPVLWGVIAAFASLVPTIGTALIAIPAVMYLAITGHTPAAIGMTIWAVLIVGMIDNLLNPFVIGSKVNIPPLLVLFAVLGGIALMGPIGILVGPLAVSLLYSLVSIYRTSFQGLES
jgi:predicted PurR-regulated permease PerM